MIGSTTLWSIRGRIGESRHPRHQHLIASDVDPIPGELAAQVVRIGRQPRVMDLLIAATAHAHDATVYTRNAADLAGLEDLITIATV